MFATAVEFDLDMFCVPYKLSLLLLPLFVVSTRAASKHPESYRALRCLGG